MSENNYLEHVVKMTKGATEAIFAAARKMPEDKVTWKPLDEGRSALEQLRECAMSPNWFAPILAHKAMPEFKEEDMAKAQQLQASWNSIDDCEKACKEHSENLYQIIRDFPESELSKVIHLPFGSEGGFDASLAEVAMFQYWNLTYHWGQINYIQTLYGDKNM